MTKSKKKDFEKMVKEMKEFLDPNGPVQKKLLHDLAFGNPVGVKITMPTPAPDGDFEILFLPQKKISEFINRNSKSKNIIELISFSEGMRLCQMANCSGGEYTYKEGQKMIALNPSLKDNNIKSFGLN